MSGAPPRPGAAAAGAARTATRRSAHHRRVRPASGHVRAADTGPPGAVRGAFELLFGLLRHIDEAPDDVIFFADEAGSWQVGVDWRTVFPAYFRCLAETATDDEFAKTVDRAIADFADHERPRHLAAARKVASATQRAALRALSAARR